MSSTTSCTPFDCLLEFKGRERSVMSPGQYTALFLLDEAWLVEAHGVRAWRADGYGAPVAVGKDMETAVLTPASVVQAIRAGVSPKFSVRT